MNDNVEGIGGRVLPFLKKLKKNNSRPWFEENKPEYKAAREQFVSFVEQLVFGIMLFDPTVKTAIDYGETAYKVFRINRDTRFSKNKLPYKENFGGCIADNPRNVHSPLYYLHIEPGNCMIAGGIYMAERDQLNAIRDDIAHDSSRLRDIITNQSFQDTFGGLDETYRLKTIPRGYPKDHPDADLLRLKSFIVTYPIKDDIIISGSFLETALKVYESMLPLMNYLRSIEVPNDAK